ncbi:hypothetical protein B0J13DRAFT_484858 [Dactylonectria estremocensis]|uniref:Uncharacterized protein n=1 Tax=Dactylonectria estremocensis TaxID=1079267 RepID=A0A9P9IL77_9HYPO|nr:hypothetical protein B0J13DRAFT_484858 [Dactylonectria estremocensis]
MTPLTCRVVDSFYSGIQGVHALLECRDQSSHVADIFESCTDEEGNIEYWFRIPALEGPPLQPEAVDIHHTPYISLTFSLSPYLQGFVAPWIHIRNDLFLTPGYRHGIILHLWQYHHSYHFEHTSVPTALPINAEQDRDIEISELGRLPLEIPLPIGTPGSPISTTTLDMDFSSTEMLSQVESQNLA